MSFAVEAIRLAESCVGEGLLHELDGPLEHIELSENEHVSLDDENFHLWRDNKDQLANYVLMRLVGRGAYGEVWLANDIINDRLVALKRLKLGDEREGFPKIALREIALLLELGDHPNIVKLLSVVHSQQTDMGQLSISSSTVPELKRKAIANWLPKQCRIKKLNDDERGIYKLEPNRDEKSIAIPGGDEDTSGITQSGSVWMVFEFTPYDLHSYIEINEQEEVKFVITELLAALEHCHSHNVLHRDLKTNLLIDFHGHIKLADFGLARTYASMAGAVCVDDAQGKVDDSTFDVTLTNRVVTLWYRPPEILLGSREYTIAADLWSLGCITYEMICGKPLFPAENEYGVLKAIYRRLGPPTDWPKYATLPLVNSPAANPLVSADTQDGQPLLGPNGSRDGSLKNKIVSLAGESGWDFVAGLLQYNPVSRLTTAEARQHSWLKKGVASCLPIDPERAVLENPIALKRDRERAKSQTGKQLQRRLINQPRHLLVQAQGQRIRQNRIHQLQNSLKTLQDSIDEKENEKKKWMDLISKAEQDAMRDESRDLPKAKHQGLSSIQEAKWSPKKKIKLDSPPTDNSDGGLEEGEIATSPSNHEAERERKIIGVIAKRKINSVLPNCNSTGLPPRSRH